MTFVSHLFNLLVHYCVSASLHKQETSYDVVDTGRRVMWDPLILFSHVFWWITVIRVFQHLDWQALIYCGNTCSSWRTVACDESLWYDLLRQHPIYVGFNWHSKWTPFWPEMQLTPSELKDTRLYRREFARRAMGLVRNHSHIPDSSHLAEYQRVIHSQR